MTSKPRLTFSQFCAQSTNTDHIQESLIPTVHLDKEGIQTILDDAAEEDWFAVNINTITLKSELMRFIDAARLANQRGIVCIIKQGKGKGN